MLPVISAAQDCTTLGQNPSSAFPVCGTNTFSQNSVPLCGTRAIPVACNDGAVYRDKNPFWYKFTCYAAGTLGFTITPTVLGDDYDWQLFDVTGRNPDDVYTDPSLFVGANWSFMSGLTGASAAGTTILGCSANPQTFSQMPVLIVGHEYLLLISHFTNTQSGYQLSFGGGTANITDLNAPLILSANANCDGTKIGVRFSKPLKCNSLALNGSDFTISPAGSVISAAGNSCNSEFNFDSVTLTLAGPLLPGNYNVVMATGSDGNSLLDNCDLRVAVGTSVPFTIQPVPPLPMGTVNPVSCSPSAITLQFTNPIKCNTIAANGSDFTITGPSTVQVTGAAGACNANGETNTITLQLSAPIATEGNYQVAIKNGLDGNTIAGDCNRQVTVGETAQFTIPVSMPSQLSGIAEIKCAPTVIRIGLTAPVLCSTIASNGSDFVITGPAPVTISGATGRCTNGVADSIDIQLASPIVKAGNYQLQLIAGSDGNTLLNACNRLSPTASLGFVAFDTVSAGFSYTVQSDCANSTVVFTHNGMNPVTSWNWTVDGNSAGSQSTFTQVFPATTQNVVKLTVSNGVCSDIRTETISLNNKVAVDFRVPDDVCPEDTVSFINESTGPIDTWAWNFGNGNISNDKNPPAQVYPATGTVTTYTVSLTGSNAQGCQDMLTKTIRVQATCIIAVPSAFTPNNDGLNDYFYPLNAFKAIELEFKVYNRWGQLVFSTTDWRIKWDGKVKGLEQPTGVYAWQLSYIDSTTGQRKYSKGTTMLIR